MQIQNSASKNFRTRFVHDCRGWRKNDGVERRWESCVDKQDAEYGPCTWDQWLEDCRCCAKRSELWWQSSLDYWRDQDLTSDWTIRGKEKTFCSTLIRSQELRNVYFDERWWKDLRRAWCRSDCELKQVVELDLKRRCYQLKKEAFHSPSSRSK